MLCFLLPFNFNSELHFHCPDMSGPNIWIVRSAALPLCLGDAALQCKAVSTRRNGWLSHQKHELRERANETATRFFCPLIAGDCW